jgi:hypothetical protein
VCAYVGDLNTWANFNEKNAFRFFNFPVLFTVSLKKSLLTATVYIIITDDVTEILIFIPPQQLIKGN